MENLAKLITSSVSVPTIGIGASKYCDGQILVIDDILGMSDIKPKFVVNCTHQGTAIWYDVNLVSFYCSFLK